MQSSYERALAAVLEHEGGYVDHPKDPGGATNKGITIANFRRYVKADGTKADLKKLTTEQAATVYRKQYWDAVSGGVLPAGVDYAVFDFGVNSGPSRAIKFLQRVVGVKQDGRIGPATLAAIAAMPPINIIRELCEARLLWLATLKTWPTFKKGWTARVSGVRKLALDLAGEHVVDTIIQEGVAEAVREAPEPEEDTVVVPPKPGVSKNGWAVLATLFLAAVAFVGKLFSNLPGVAS
jgi:lysozyme family protein